MLNPVNAGQPLHASSQELIDNPGCKEVGSQFRNASNWRVFLFIFCVLPLKSKIENNTTPSFKQTEPQIERPS